MSIHTFSLMFAHTSTHISMHMSIHTCLYACLYTCLLSRDILYRGVSVMHPQKGWARPSCPALGPAGAGTCHSPAAGGFVKAGRSCAAAGKFGNRTLLELRDSFVQPPFAQGTIVKPVVFRQLAACDSRPPCATGNFFGNGTQKLALKSITSTGIHVCTPQLDTPATRSSCPIKATMSTAHGFPQ